MKRSLFAIIALVVAFAACSPQQRREDVARPKLVIGLVIDQMRWDYLYRYYDRYESGGFKRLLHDGYSCQNTMIPYLPAFTGPGHSCIYTGSVPSIHGIAANDWIENLTGAARYCVDDSSVHLVNGPGNTPSMSPRNLLASTITDELRLATNLRSRVFGIALKDRSSILPAGHLANAAYWYDDSSATFTTSTYYPDQSPTWLAAFNRRKVGDSLVKQNWKLLYAQNTYLQSTTDANNYEKKFSWEAAPVFPHMFDTLAESDRHKAIRTMPAGNTYTLAMAKACIEGEKLGQGDVPDFLAVSLSSTDYVGHQFGPNSIEAEDMYLRLDKDLAAFLDYLDSKVGKGNYLLFLSADHGAAHNATFLQDNDVPAGILSAQFMEELNTYLKSVYGKDSIVSHALNYQLYLDNNVISAAGADRETVKESIREWLNKRPEIAYAIDLENIDKTPLPDPIRTMVVNGYNRLRSGCMEVILNPGWYDNGGKGVGTTHGTWQPYDTHIPLIWYGWHVAPGELFCTVHMTDISPTLAAMLHIQMPNGCIGQVITEVAGGKQTNTQL